jgi:hypothetical protein
MDRSRASTVETLQAAKPKVLLGVLPVRALPVFRIDESLFMDRTYLGGIASFLPPSQGGARGMAFRLKCFHGIYNVQLFGIAKEERRRGDGRCRGWLVVFVSVSADWTGGLLPVLRRAASARPAISFLLGMGG